MNEIRNRRGQRERYLKHSLRYLAGRIPDLESQTTRWAYLRLLVFVGGLGSGIVLRWVHEPLSWSILALSLVLFFWLSRRFAVAEASLQKHRVWERLQKAQLGRLNLDWQAIPEEKVVPAVPDHPFDSDLDITGKNSLHRLLDLSISREGSHLLAGWLRQTHPDPEETRQRQAVVRELRDRPGFCNHFQLAYYLSGDHHFSAARLRDILREDPLLDNAGRSLAGAVILTVTNALLAVLTLAEILPVKWLGLSVGIYAIYYLWHTPLFRSAFEKAMELEVQLGSIRELLMFLECYPRHKIPALGGVLAPFREFPPSVELKKILRILLGIGLRMNPLMTLACNIALPWDFLLAMRVKGMRGRLQQNLERWLPVLTQLEGLVSLANFCWLNPNYQFPALSEDRQSQPLLLAEATGHPLLPEAGKVRNDFRIDRIGDTVLVTGSNMAGKSTFLRTLGTNLVLAYAGAAVDAREFRTVPMRIYCCIRVSDSVTDGFSYFYAEVRRLRGLLEALEEQEAMPLFFLIDEIFRGTNNRERFIGSKAYLEAITGSGGGVGIISTHDLELTHLAKQETQLRNVHFRESVVENRMVFDYLLREGPCPTTNALIIMKLAGLPVPDSTASSE